MSPIPSQDASIIAERPFPIVPVIGLAKRMVVAVRTLKFAMRLKIARRKHVLYKIANSALTTGYVYNARIRFSCKEVNAFRNVTQRMWIINKEYVWKANAAVTV